MKTKEQLAMEYNIIGDDVEIMYGAYENFIYLDEYAEEDAEELVYSEMASTCDFVGTPDDVLDFLADTCIILQNYTKLESGNYAININC